MLVLITLACYVAGAGFALAATHSGTPSWWARFIRGQFLVAGATLSVAAGWRFELGAQLLEAIALAAVLYLITAVSVLTRNQGGRRRSLGECVLEAWAANPNTAYWTVPLATVLVGPTGTVVAVLSDQILIPAFVWWVNRLRRDAPFPQRAHTGLFDYAGAIGFAGGLLLAQFVAPPGWTSGFLGDASCTDCVARRGQRADVFPRECQCALRVPLSRHGYRVAVRLAVRSGRGGPGLARGNPAFLIP